MPFQLSVYPFDQDSPLILDPFDQGYLLTPIPAGNYVEAYVLFSVPPDVEAQVVIVMSPDAVTYDCGLYLRGAGTLSGRPTHVMAEPYALHASGAVLIKTGSFACKTLQDSAIVIAIYSVTTPPTVFAGEVVVKTYS